MEGFKTVRDSRCYPMGTTAVDGGMHFSVASAGDTCSLVLYRKGGQEEAGRFHFSEEERVGDVWNLTVLAEEADFREIEYCYEMDGVLTEDPFGRHFTGRENWGDFKKCGQVLRASFVEEDYDWEGDQPLFLPYEQSILYRIHPRGFTKHASSNVENRGTFAGIAEKIPYLKELGITTLELMPSIEFPEVMVRAGIDKNPFEPQTEEATGKVNYWGFVPGLYFAPKASYCSGKEKKPEKEFKDLVKALHKAGIELVMDMFFTGQEPELFVAAVLRFWVREYHVDGFHLIGFAPCGMLGKDPYLSRVKLWAQSWEGVSGGRFKHLAEYGDGFAGDMKRLLKGDEDQLNALVFRNKRNPKDYAVINYMANSNGFTMMDNVCYDVKHNEANGEHNQDGSDYNYSWNCGVEGPTKKKKVVEMRKKLLRNSFLLTFLSQGTPLLLSGDEFGNSKRGNNNSYCQDNEISWLNWKQTTTNPDILEFARAVIQFRKDHPVFRMPEEPKGLDYKSCGQPDVSYHGVKAWCPEFENFRRQLGIFYCGQYGQKADGTPDDYFFVAYNMHWEPHEFSLPNLPKELWWHVAMNTDAKEVNGIYPPGEELCLEDQKHFLVEPRSIVVFIGKELSPEEQKRREELRKKEKAERAEKAAKKKGSGGKKKPENSKGKTGK
ncbi:MAG: alpha-amylase [Lachnospiraceae bacterium]|nr:alpha-amylase [Lachnospiraceae bacterium]